MSSRREYEMSFKLNAKLGGAYNSTFKSAQREVVSMQKELDAFNKIQSDISAYQKQQGALDATKKKLDVLQQQYENIQREIGETEGFSASLENQLLSKQQQIDKTTASLSAQTEKLQKFSNALNDAGIDTENLTGESAKLGEQIDTVRKKQEAAADGAGFFGERSTEAVNSIYTALAAAGIAKLIKEIGEGFMECAEASIGFESAMAGVSKTTELSDAELSQMSEEIKALSTEIPATAEEIAAVTEAAGQLGIEKDTLLDFAEVMTNLGVATNMTASEAATMLARFANITQMDASQYSNLGSVIVQLGNSFATTESEITSMGMNIASAGTQVGMTQAEIMGVAAALSSLGLEAEAGGTAVSKLMIEMAVAAETGSDKLNDFADVAGMTSGEFSELFGSSATQAMAVFFNGLGNGGESAIATLTDMGVTETRLRDAILRMASAEGIFTEAVDMATVAMDDNTALTMEAEKRYATTQSQLILMQNSYNNLKVAIGDALTPALRENSEILSDALGDVTRFVQQNPGVVKAVVALTASLAAFTAALIGYTIATKAAKAIQDAFNASLWTNPFAIAAAGVSLLIGGMVLLATSTRSAAEEQAELSATSREQYAEVQKLNAAYKESCETIGETEAETLLLKKQLDEATASFEESKQTAEEVAAAQKELIQSHQELAQAYDTTIKSLDNELAGSMSLIKKLDELMAVEGKSAAAKQEILAVVELLNEAMPELGLAYDQYADSLNMSAEAIRSVIQAEIAREKNAANYARLKELIAGETEAYKTLQEAIADTEAAELLLADAEAARAAKTAELGSLVGEAGGRAYASAIMPYINAVNAAQQEVNDLAAAEATLQESYDADMAEQQELLVALGDYVEGTSEAGAATTELGAAISGTTQEMQMLAEAYTEAYNAALESVQGQYDLWDTASQVVATGAGAINEALKSQITYWQDYNANLAGLGERSTEIEGLSEIIASFADGSEGSVNAIAGMASATDEELAAMVRNWQDLQTEQKTVSDSIAALEIDLANAVDAMQEDLESSIKEMNLSSEAAESGKNTVQGFIDGANDMLPAIKAAYAAIAQAAVDAIDAQLDINSPSKVLELRGEYAMSGFVGGVENMTPDVQEAMSSAAGAGASAFTDEEAVLVSFAPKLMSYLSALSGVDAVGAQLGNPAAGSGGEVFSPVANVTINFQGTAGAEHTLEEYGDSLKDQIVETLEDLWRDQKRRRYS